MRAKEFINESKTTLNNIYDGDYPDEDELIWNFVGNQDFDVPFTVKTLSADTLKHMLLDTYGVDELKDLFRKMQPDQKATIEYYKDDPSLSNHIIIVNKNIIVDGNHRALAAVLANKNIKCVDISEEPINEVFTSNVSGELVRSTSDLYTTKARIGGRTIVFNAAQYDDDEGKSGWEIDFVEYVRNGLGTTFGKTGSGGELQVFSFVIESIKDLIATYHPDQLTFTSHKADNNRTKLYQRMLNRIKVPGYHAAPVDSGDYDDYFKIVKDNLSEDDSPIRIKLNNNNAANAWIERVYAKYPAQWENNHVMVWGSGDDQQFAMFELIPSMSRRGAVEVKWFQAYPLRQGVGSRAMQELQAMAREDGIALTLYPWDKGQVSQAKLTKFYRGQGFRPAMKGSKNMAWSPEIAEAELDSTGWGATPQGTDIDYFGLKVKMRPSTFLKLSHPLNAGEQNSDVEKHMQGGGKIAYPFLEIKDPVEWEDGDFSQPGKVVNHEGRNRMTHWIKMKGDEPIQVNVFLRGANRRRYVTDDMIQALSQGLISQTGQLVKNPFEAGTALDEAEVGTSNAKAIANQLKAAGYSNVGTGADSTVWAKDDSHIIKILMPEDLGTKAEQVFRKFYKFAMSHQDLECMPRFNEVNTIDINGKDYTQIEMERLAPIEKGTFMEGVIWFFSDFCQARESWDKVDHAMGLSDTWEWYPYAKSSKSIANVYIRQWQDLVYDKKSYSMYRQLYNVMKLLYTTGTINKFGWDLHTANVMQRSNGQPVIIDPWFSEGTS